MTSFPQPFFRRTGLFIIAALLLSVPFVLLGASRALQQRDNRVRQWLPGGFQETRQYDWFLEHFGSEEFAVVSWQGCNARDPRLEQLASRLTDYSVRPAAEHETEHGGQPRWFERVVTGPQAVRDLRGEPFHLSMAEAIRRLEGTLLGIDGETTGLLLVISAPGQEDRHAAVETIYREAAAVGLSRDELHLGGPTIDSVALDQESERSRYALSTLSVFLALAAAWRCLRQVYLVVTVFFTALYCGALSLALVHLTGGTMNLVMVTMPTLVYVLAISGAIHVTNYFRKETLRSGSRGAAERAFRAGWLPCALTALTTAIGLSSLAISNVVPVRMFGIYSALGVISSLPVVLFFLPAALAWWPRHEVPIESAAEVRPPIFADNEGSWTGAMTRFVTRWHAAITVAGLLVLVYCGIGLTRLETSVKLINFFSPHSRVLSDYRWLETHLGPLVPIEVVIKLSEDHSSTLLDRLQLVTDVQQQIAAIPHVNGTMSAATFTPPIPAGGGVRQVTRKTLLEKQLSANRDALAEAGYLRTSGTQELWRVSARVEAMNDLDYGQFVDRLRREVEPVLDRHRQGGELDAVYTGVVPLIYKAQRVLLRDLTTSFLSAFGVIAVVMLLMLRGIRPGVVSMLPNVFPAILVFGTMGWMGRLCDIGSMMTASVALGIAVDDTIHFLSWFQRGVRAGRSRVQSVAWAYHHCGTAMLQTTLICGIGMLGFALSSFVPTARFAGLMSTLLAVALVGDLIFLPALLAGPLGKYFEHRQQLATGRIWWHLPGVKLWRERWATS